MTPIRYGLDKINVVAINSIQIIFNMYGRRLLKMEDDKIIERNECQGDRDIFYLYPLHLQPIEQDIGLNLFKIASGSILNLVVSVPWRAILSEPTIITVESISIQSIFEQNTNSIYFRSLESTNSYFLEHPDTPQENHNLVSTYRDIKKVLSKYFDRINLHINQITISIENYFTIEIINLAYADGKVSIERASIMDSNRCICAEMDGLTFIEAQHRLQIQRLHIDPRFIDCIPEFYTEPSESTMELALELEQLVFGLLQATHITAQIQPNRLLLNQLASVTVDKLAILNIKPVDHSQTLLTLDLLGKTCYFDSVVDLKLGDTTALVLWAREMESLGRRALDKVIVVDRATTPESSIDTTLDTKPPFSMYRIQACIVHADDVLQIKVGSVVMGAKGTYECATVLARHGATEIRVENLVIDLPSLVLTQTAIKTNTFDASSQYSTFTQTETDSTVSLDHANTTSIIDLINFVTDSVARFKHSKPTTDLNQSRLCDSKPHLVHLHVTSSTVRSSISDMVLDIGITEAQICITNRSAKQVTLQIVADQQLLANTTIASISPDSVTIERLTVFMDPLVFDKLNKLCGTLAVSDRTLSPPVAISPEALKQLQEALTRSIIVDSIEDLEQSISDMTACHTETLDTPHLFASPQFQVFIESMANLRSTIVDDYVCPDDAPLNLFSLRVRSIHGYLFTRMPTYNPESTSIQSSAFLCVVIKHTTFTQTTETCTLPPSPPISIRVGGATPKPASRSLYNIHIQSGAIIDTLCRDPIWKYFVRLADHQAISCNTSLQGNYARIAIEIKPVVSNIREETLLKLLTFVSRRQQLPSRSNPNSNLIIESFRIQPIQLCVSYYPVMLEQNLGTDAFTLRELTIKLSPYQASFIGDADALLLALRELWTTDIDPSNILQFVPNIKIIQPYAASILNAYDLVSKYFQSVTNQNRMRAITSTLEQGTSMASVLIKQGYDHIMDLFTKGTDTNPSNNI